MKTDKTFKTPYRLFLFLLLLAASALPARAQLLPAPIDLGHSHDSGRLIVQAPGGINVVQLLCSLVGCTPVTPAGDLVEIVGDPSGQLFVINALLPELVYDLEQLLGIALVEVDRLINLPSPAPLISPTTPAPPGLLDTNQVSFYGSPVWNGYAAQPADGVIRASQARNWFNVNGMGTIAIIDTGVDPNHPALTTALACGGGGYDFTQNTQGGSESFADLNQSTVAVVDGGATPVMVNGTTMAVLDQSTVAVVDGHSAFGHGTMVAGIVHLVAPTSCIMPLKAFTADGTGYTSDIIRAIYYAVQNGASALNMSFSMSGYSTSLKNALDYAAAQGVVNVAAAGNDGQQITVYPAGFWNTMGVGSTDLFENRSSFSNYGSDVTVAAPGEGIITTYPGGTYAAGWGTSFSTPFVTGTVGLLVNLQPKVGQQAASSDIGHAEYIGQGLGHGELDVVRALNAATQNQNQQN